MKLHVAPLRPTFLDRVRTLGLDDQDQAVRRMRSTAGGEPCRDVLRRARPGEEVILASHCPFDQAGPYRELGPVFVLAEPTGEEIARDRLPLPSGSAVDYFRGRLAIRAYGHDESILAAELVSVDRARALSERLLEREEVAFLHARFPTYGCFACRIERAA